MTSVKCPECGKTIPKDKVSCPFCGAARSDIFENCCINKECSGYMEILPHSCDFCPICHEKTAERQVTDLIC